MSAEEKKARIIITLAVATTLFSILFIVLLYEPTFELDKSESEKTITVKEYPELDGALYLKDFHPPEIVNNTLKDGLLRVEFSSDYGYFDDGLGNKSIDYHISCVTLLVYRDWVPSWRWLCFRQ